MPLERWTDAAHPAAFLAACAAEHVRGARIVSALRVLGPEQGEFYLRDGMAMYVEDGILLVAAPPEAELAPELLPPGLREIHGPEHLCRELHRRLGGELKTRTRSRRTRTRCSPFCRAAIHITGSTCVTGRGLRC